MRGTNSYYRKRPPQEFSIGGTVAILLTLWGIIAFVSYPVLVGTGLIVTVVAALVVQKLLRSYLERIENSTRKLTIPGVGEIRYRVTPR